MEAFEDPGDDVLLVRWTAVSSARMVACRLDQAVETRVPGTMVPELMGCLGIPRLGLFDPVANVLALDHAIVAVQLDSKNLGGFTEMSQRPGFLLTPLHSLAISV